MASREYKSTNLEVSEIFLVAAQLLKNENDVLFSIIRAFEAVTAVIITQDNSSANITVVTEDVILVAEMVYYSIQLYGG